MWEEEGWGVYIEWAVGGGGRVDRAESVWVPNRTWTAGERDVEAKVRF